MGHRRFCGGPQSYSKNWLLGSKSYFSYSYWRTDKNLGLRCADLFSAIKAIALPELKTFVFFGHLGKNRSPRVEKPFFLDQGSHWANNADSKVETFFFFEAVCHRAIAQQQWSAGQCAMQTFKKHKMGHGSENVENHCSRAWASEYEALVLTV